MLPLHYRRRDAFKRPNSIYNRSNSEQLVRGLACAGQGLFNSI